MLQSPVIPGRTKMIVTSIFLEATCAACCTSKRAKITGGVYLQGALEKRIGPWVYPFRSPSMSAEPMS